MSATARRKSVSKRARNPARSYMDRLSIKELWERYKRANRAAMDARDAGDNEKAAALESQARAYYDATMQRETAVEKSKVPAGTRGDSAFARKVAVELGRGQLTPEEAVTLLIARSHGDQRRWANIERAFHVHGGSELKNPLRRGYSRATMSANIAQEIRAGHPPAQAEAIAYRAARAAWRKAHPGRAYPAHLNRKRNPHRGGGERTPAQRAATRKMLAANKARRRASTRRPRRANPRAPRDYQIFKARGWDIWFLAMTGLGKLRWTLTRGDALRWHSRKEATRLAARLGRQTKYADWDVGVAPDNTDVHAIHAQLEHLRKNPRKKSARVAR